jgi:hypothetical protein
MTIYEEITDEDAIRLPFGEDGEAGAQMACCDCGLVHTWIFSLEVNDDEELSMCLKVIRNQRSTGQLRRYGGGSLQRGECPVWEMLRRSA